MNWIKSIAPTIGIALAGPLGGAAASFLAEKLGIQKKTIEAVSSATVKHALVGDMALV